MAKTQGPLFSLGASGTVAKLLTFNQSNDTPVARKKPRASTSATTDQQAARADFANAAQAWRALPQAERDTWKSIAAQTGRPAFAKYFLEWKAQASTPAQPPYLPMA